MDALGETIQNVGLAQEIQNGLAKGMQKEPAWADAGATAAKADALRAMGPVALYSQSRLARYIMDGWTSATGKSFTGGDNASRGSVAFTSGDEPEGGTGAWEEFCSTGAFDLMTKYAALADKLGSEPISSKLFHEMRPLGRGAFGAVFLVFKKDTGMALATKKMVKGIAKKNKMLNDVLIEREVLAKIRSPFCVNLHYAFQDDVCVYLTLTLCPGGDLTFLLKTRYTDEKSGKKCDFRKLGDETVKFYAASMAAGLQAIHEAGYVYRDLKPQNVLLDSEGQVRISDMGLTADITKGKIKQKSGTCGYWSPETIQKQEYTTEPDWWSLGVTVFVLYSDKMPFSGKEDEEKNAATLKGEINYKHGEPEVLQSFVSALCEIDMAKRLGCSTGLQDLKDHPYFAGFDWTKLEYGQLPAPIQPNVNDINAPSAKDIAAFVPPKDVTWEAADQEKFAKFEYMDVELHGDEAIARMKKRKELNKALGTKGGAAPKLANETAGTSPTIAYAKANRESKKGEDFAATVMKGDGAPAAFAVFDGHSGKETARLCSETVCQRLIEKGPPFDPQAIKDMMWAVDEEIGTKGLKDGATAQTLFVEKVGDKLKGTFAWCGDSSAVLADMETGEVIFTTSSHTAGPDHQESGSWKEEKVILEWYGAVRKSIEEVEGIDTVKDDVTPEMVDKAIAACASIQPADTSSFLLAGETLPGLMLRALRRGKVIYTTNPDNNAMMRKKVFVRQRDKDHDVNQVWVVSTAEKRSDPGYSDLQMTRSICDWRAADMVLPNPQIHTFEVPAGKIYRVCLASDGLWDVCDFKRAAGLMQKAPTVQKAAKDLLRIPEKVYLEERGHDMMDDDTTVLCIELNPSGIKHQAPGGGGCCSLM